MQYPQTFIEFLVERPDSELTAPIPTKVGFHDTADDYAIKIIKVGAIQTIDNHNPNYYQDSIDNQDDLYDEYPGDEFDPGRTEEEGRALAADYTKWVYASTHPSQEQYGTTTPEVMFVFDMSKFRSLEEVTYSHDTEGGLLQIPFDIPLSAVFHIHISAKTWHSHIGRNIVESLKKYPHIKITAEPKTTRIEVIKQYMGKGGRVR